MSHPPSEVLSVITNFLPNDDITDLMLMSKTFNAHVTPRLRKIDEEMSIVNQSIESFMPSPPPETDDEWISQLNLKQFEPIGSVAKRRVKQLFADCQFVRIFDEIGTRMELDVRTLDRLKKAMSLERFDNETYLRILFALVFTPKFCQKYNISRKFTFCFRLAIIAFYPRLKRYRLPSNIEDLNRIWKFYH